MQISLDRGKRCASTIINLHTIIHQVSYPHLSDAPCRSQPAACSSESVAREHNIQFGVNAIL